MALNFLAMSDFDRARVAITQTHEREAVIADLRAKEVAAVERDASKRGASTSFKELNGYPVQTIDNPQVNALKNSYQSALSHYLAGFIYEALGETSLAAPGYRQAIELQPNQPLLEEGLRGLDQRLTAATASMRSRAHAADWLHCAAECPMSNSTNHDEQRPCWLGHESEIRQSIKLLGNGAGLRDAFSIIEASRDTCFPPRARRRAAR